MFFSLNHICKFGDLRCYKLHIAESQNTPHLITVLQTKVDEMEQMIKSLQSEIVALKNINKCEVCDYMATSNNTRKTHMTKKHKHASEAAPMEKERIQLNDASMLPPQRLTVQPPLLFSQLKKFIPPTKSAVVFPDSYDN